MRLDIIKSDTGEFIKEDISLEELKGIFKDLSDKDRENKVKELFWILENEPLKLSYEDLSLIRKINNKSAKVQLKYTDGFYMVANNLEDNAKKLSFEGRGVILTLGFMMNKSGILVYKNGRRITSFEKLRLNMGMSDRVWRRVKKEFDKFDILRKRTIGEDIYILINPKFTSKAYEITEFKFIVFADYFKENLGMIDFLYLCKKFDINLT